MKPSFYFRVGLFVLGAFAILVTALIAFGGGNLLRPKLYIETYVMSSVQGVDIGSPVKFRGLTIGKVSSLEFAFNVYPQQEDENAYNYIRVVMQIDRQVFPGMFRDSARAVLDRSIQHGLRIRIEPLGITGSSYMNLDYVSVPSHYSMPNIQWKPRYAYIPSAPGEVTGLLDSVNKIMRDLETINIGKMAQKLSLLLQNINQALDQLQVRELREDVDSLIIQLKQATQDAQLGKLSSKASSFFDKSTSLVQNLDKTNRTLERTLKNWESVGDESKNTLQSLQQISEDVKRRPSVLFWGKPSLVKKQR